MLAATSSMGGWNVADSMASGRLEKGTQQSVIDSSERQAEVSGWQRNLWSRQREFMTVGADIRARLRDEGAVSG